ncbi:uncharacterized protein LOC111356290 [Spodoptera litura]|uniref:Uncharacterized protein LOC111356290 n=1 Tax=Spodoptera litura TaxID=69820 RepID=A0A9J7EF44_SPOLT|nr:uncharacterized protein LOC111356290 [Spodoptera litura]
MPPARRANIGRRTRNANDVALLRRSQTADERAQANASQRERNARNGFVNPVPVLNLARPSRIRRAVLAEMMRAAFNYNSQIDYSETPGMCCANGKVRLPALETPPEPLYSFIFGTSQASKHFLSHIQQYNSAFQMTSFGATKIIRDNFMPTFKIQGQIYHQAGSLLPYPDADHQFLQIYFIGDENRELDQRCAIVSNTRREIIRELQRFFHQHNALVQLFKIALDRMPTDNHKIVIRADRTPFGEHARRFNAPTIDEVAIVILGDQFQSRDIVLHRRNEQLQRVSELHRSYDALQYPILHWKGDDGYHINIPMIDPRTGLHIQKKVSAMNFYSYRLMIRPQEQNYILKCGKLYHQYIVDMYAKIETERLNFIRFNQAKLRSEEYIHLQDAIANDANVNDIGHPTLLLLGNCNNHLRNYVGDAVSHRDQSGSKEWRQSPAGALPPDVAQCRARGR